MFAPPICRRRWRNNAFPFRQLRRRRRLRSEHRSERGEQSNTARCANGPTRTRSRLGAAPDSSFLTARGAELVQNSRASWSRSRPPGCTSTSSVYPRAPRARSNLRAAGLRRRRDHDRHRSGGGGHRCGGETPRLSRCARAGDPFALFVDHSAGLGDRSLVEARAISRGGAQARCRRCGCSSPFRWQRDYARSFVEGVRRLAESTGILMSVENMYPWRTPGGELKAYVPGWDPTELDYDDLTLSLTPRPPTSSRLILFVLGDRGYGMSISPMGQGRPRMSTSCQAEATSRLAGCCNTLQNTTSPATWCSRSIPRKSGTRAQREADLAESLAFARLNFAAPIHASYAVDAAGVASEL